ncbi:MAG: DUF1295 domain-containing protein [Flavobacteriales bacterium]|nr:DUF1295 domain-containing protein [Flavobacteriales bacterium]
MALYEEFKSQGNILFKYRGLIPVFLLVPGVLVFVYQNSYSVTPEVMFERWYWLTCFGVGLLGLLIRSIAIGYAARNTSGRNTEDQKATEVNRTGLYSMVRHPLYLGNYFMWLSIAMLTAHLGFCIIFTLLYWLYYERIMFAEEEFLRNKFGEIYTDWSNGVPAFVPSFSNYTTSTEDFKLKDVLNRERNGLLALMLIFYAFRAMRIFLTNGEFMPELDIWTISLIIVIIIFIILKVLKKTTSFFDHKAV